MPENINKTNIEKQSNSSCPDCNRKFVSIISLSLHYRKSHKKTSKDLYIALYCDNKIPTCKCGCVEETKFLNITLGFREYKQGHISRIKNNWGHNEKIIKKSQKTRKIMVENGDYIPFHLKETGEHWAKGLTKETDERLANLSKSLRTEKIRKFRSDTMRKNRLNGTIPTFKGKKHHSWKGGTSNLYACCMANQKFYKEWKLPLLKAADFTCEKCGKNNYNTTGLRLHVHHDREKFSDILRKVADKNHWFLLISTNLNLEVSQDDSTIKLKEKIAKEVVEYHLFNNVSGQVLCTACHKLEHKSLNFKTIETI
jgi:hypothetical protein